MDRTIIAPWKAEERELSEKLYQKLLGLTLLYPPSDEFRKCFSDEMFLKPNQPAFFQVMQYLFKLHDPNEFRKRFYWPINDKRAEANFRSATIEYLKYLDAKHQLHWSNIKSYLVQMPGGMKFITFLLDLVSFVISEQIKHREKHLSMEGEFAGVTDLNLKRMQKQNEFFKEYASVYISEADALIVKLKERTTLVRKEFTKIANTLHVNFADLTAVAFSEEFEASNRELFVQKFKKPAANISDLEPLLVQLKETFENFQNKRTEWQVDEDAVRYALTKIKAIFPPHDADDEEFHVGESKDAVRINTLVSAFTTIYPTIREQLEMADKIPRSNNFLKVELSTLQNEFQQIEAQILEFQKKINAHTKRKYDLKLKQSTTPSRSGIDATCQVIPEIKGNNLLAKFVATPPIKLELSEGNRGDVNTRLSLLEDVALNAERLLVANAKTATDSLHNLLAIPRSARKIKNLDSSVDLNSTVNKSKIIDPIQLLRTINKDTSQSKKALHDRSTANFRWKNRQYIFGNDINDTSKTNNNTNNTNSKEDRSTSENTGDLNSEYRGTPTHTITSPFNSLHSNDRTRIPQSTRTQEINCVGGCLLFSKKLSAVKKVQTSSLNFHNLSTSPSGRLDPLVTLEEKDVPKLQLNDVTLSAEDSVSGKPNPIKVPAKAYATSAAKSFIDQAVENNENNGNLTNAAVIYQRFNLSGFSDENELFNISDSVLKDVIM